MVKAKLEQKSPAEFFAENKNIAGFDNVGADVSDGLSTYHGQLAHFHVKAVLLHCSLEDVCTRQCESWWRTRSMPPKASACCLT
jgi:hypothetical protein